MCEIKKYKIGYTQGVFDMFHVGHLNILKRAKQQCDYLIVGVNSDALVCKYKNKTPVINEINRMDIINNIKAVDKVVLAKTLDKKSQHESLKFNAIFIGSDWINDIRWQNTIEEMEKINVDVVFLPHTDGVSSTMLKTVENNKVGE